MAQRLEELLKLKAEERITQLELLKAYTEIQDIIIEQQKEGESKGFKTERERAVYDAMKVLFAENAEDAAKTIFDLINGELNIVGWQGKGQVKKDIENKIRRYLTTAKIDREVAKQKAKELVDVLIKNKDA